MKVMKIIALVIGLLYLVYRSYRFMQLDKDLDRVIRRGAVVLDVRTEREFRTGHIAGALNIPLSHLHADSLPLDRSSVYITVCSHGLRSVKAASLLQQKGYRVHNGGAWPDLENTLLQQK